MNAPLDYSLCDQTVTLYRREKNSVIRKKLTGCFYSRQEVLREEEYGVRRETKCLLIVPGNDCPVAVGDRIYPGEGPLITLNTWDTFLPVTVPGLAEINYVSPCCWEGEICHIEAGRK